MLLVFEMVLLANTAWSSVGLLARLWLMYINAPNTLQN